MCIIVTVGPEIEYWEESDTEIMYDMDQPIPQDMNMRVNLMLSRNHSFGG